MKVRPNMLINFAIFSDRKLLDLLITFEIFGRLRKRFPSPILPTKHPERCFT